MSPAGVGPLIDRETAGEGPTPGGGERLAGEGIGATDGDEVAPSGETLGDGVGNSDRFGVVVGTEGVGAVAGVAPTRRGDMGSDRATTPPPTKSTTAAAHTAVLANRDSRRALRISIPTAHDGLPRLLRPGPLPNRRHHSLTLR